MLFLLEHFSLEYLVEAENKYEDALYVPRELKLVVHNFKHTIIMMNIIIIIMAYITILIPTAIVADMIGEKLEKWLNNHFPNVEE